MDIATRYEEMAKEFNARTPRGMELYQQAQKILPGGETRSAVNMYPHPMYIESAAGTDVYKRQIFFSSNRPAGFYGRPFFPLS